MKRVTSVVVKAITINCQSSKVAYAGGIAQRIFDIVPICHVLLSNRFYLHMAMSLYRRKRYAGILLVFRKHFAWCIKF